MRGVFAVELARWFATAAAIVPTVWTATAFADAPPDPSELAPTPASTLAINPAPITSGPVLSGAPDERPNPFARATPPDDPTGGTYTTPTLLFIPAGAVPTWNVRVITSLDVQGPTAPDRLASGTSVGFQPGIAGELGLPRGLHPGRDGVIAV